MAEIHTKNLEFPNDQRPPLVGKQGEPWPTRHRLAACPGESWCGIVRRCQRVSIRRGACALAIFADFEPVARSGTSFVYSSYGYNLAGAVVEAAARQPFAEYMQQHLWQPLGMNDTVIDLPDPIIANRVSGYRLVDGELVNSEYTAVPESLPRLQPAAWMAYP
jgi:hypothetical protein